VKFVVVLKVCKVWVDGHARMASRNLFSTLDAVQPFLKKYIHWSVDSREN